MSDQLKNKKIFIIEDDNANLAVIKTILELNGAKVQVERWGNNVIHQLHAFAIVDVILLDLMFPRGITGYDIFDEIKAVSDFQKIPIIAVSATNKDVAIPICKSKGFAGFLSKPINYDKFSSQIANIIEGNPIWGDNNL